MADIDTEQMHGEDHASPDFRLSALLGEIAEGPEEDRISIGDLLAALKRRALGALIFIFAVPVALPLPPGVSTVFGAPLLFLTAQLMLGMKPWLPGIITNRSLKRSEFKKIITTRRAVAAPRRKRDEAAAAASSDSGPSSTCSG